MRVNWSRLILGVVTVVVILGAGFLVMRPTATTVDFSKVELGPLRVTVESDGKTRIKDLYAVNAPVNGRLLRINLDPGDPVGAGQVIATIEPTEPTFLTARDLSEAKAKVLAAEATRDQAKADLERTKTEVEYAQYTYKRTKSLNTTGYYSQEKLEEAELTVKTKIANREVAEKTLVTKEFELKRAQAEMQPPSSQTSYRSTPEADCLNITSPVDGRVLSVAQESETIISAGATVAQVGDPRSLEIVLEMLTEDAVKVRAGAEVIIEQWGGASDIKGKVRLVEPYGFTKTSALGIEEQRVNVIVDFDESYENWQHLAHAFKVVARVVWWESPEVVKVPMGALFRQRNRWAVYVVDNGFSRLRNVDVGHSTTREAEVVAGLKEGDTVILHPSDRIRDGARVASRLEGK